MEEIVLKCLKKTDVEKRLTIPSKSLKCFPPLSGEHTVDFRVRDESGQVWKFRIYTRKNNKKYLKPVLTKGWREFVCRKKLGVGDRVAFYMEREQAGAVNYRVKVEKAVKIFGVVIYQKPIRFHNDTNPVQSNSFYSMSSSVFAHKPIKFHNDTNRLQSNSFYFMSSSMKKIMLKDLKKTDIEKRLTIPSKALDYFPPLRGQHTVDFQVRDEIGHVWKFRIYTRKNNKYLKPVLTKGWREFVCTRELEVDDRVGFYMDREQTNAVRYRVEVEKAVRIFGSVLAHKPIHSETSPVQERETVLSISDQGGRPKRSSKAPAWSKDFIMGREPKPFK